MASEMDTKATTSTQSIPKTLKRKSKLKAKKPIKKLKGPRNSAMAEARKRKKPSKRMLQMFSKRAKRYDSDSDSDEEEEREGRDEEDERDDGLSGSEGEGEGEGKEHGGITRFSEGCRAFKVAFLKIMKKNLPNDPLGPILAAHKKLVVAKLAEEEEEHKTKGHARKKKQLVEEKGHVKPESYLDAKEKLLIGIATKGVVRLFNAVSKAQNPQKGLNPSTSKDAKALAKQRKQTFLSELKKQSAPSVDEESNELGWAPLRDSYMLGSKLKDWDKMADTSVGGDDGEDYMQSSSDEE
ncbi:RRP15-like protein [Rhynchospora pubera]|uniref:RRP15-like protein n=1 Tax=Rhynchospora pubera TaxID=906938 RepID=A0AAV8H4E9_9POAL|nr:RRP15-like protein [Rhynchospora pubera]